MNRNLSFDLLSTDDMTDEEFFRAKDEFYEKYPECPIVPHIERLDLVMRREWAEKILSGEKKVEFRDFTDFYIDRLYDKKMVKFVDKLMADKDDGTLAYGVFYNPVRIVDTIHFHNYNNSWFLDVSVEANDVMAITADGVEFLQEEFNCHELDLELKRCRLIPENVRPQKFYFIIDKILDTNLK